MSEAIYTVVGPKSVFGVAPGDSSDFEGVDPGALHALIAGGHIDYAKAPDLPVADDLSPDQGAAPEPEVQPELAPVEPAPEPDPPAPDAPVAPAVQQEQQAPPAGAADDTSKEA